MQWRRVRLVVGACTVVVLLVTVAGLWFGGFITGGQRAAADSVTPAVVIGGHPVPYDRPQSWTDASIASRRSIRLDVFVTGSTDSGGGACGPPVVRFRVTETTRAVKVLVADYETPSDLTTACSAIGYAPGPHLVHLARALGDRAVIDASTGRRAHVIVESQLPTLDLPKDLRSQPAVRYSDPTFITRSWLASDGGAAVTITDQLPASVRVQGPYGRVALQSTIRGTPATVYQGVGTSPGTWIVQWTPSNSQTITLTVSAAGKYRWTADSALTLARTVTGYQTRPTGRLGQPTVHGTVAATYNSADGPVHDAENLLKSSGVYVAADCLGAGTLTITIRHQTHHFTCTSTLSHHTLRSAGPPDDAFTLSADASPGVRWSISLARQTLDGS